MPKEFNVPPFYRSEHISAIKLARRITDPRKKDLRPSVIDFGPVRFKLARHFGFCYGVENAIEIAYRAVEENPDKRIFLLSEMIHNPGVNKDLLSRGVQFLMNTDGSVRIDFQSLTKDDIVIVPAFGTTVELQKTLSKIGIDPYFYDTTCPFVEKVWKRSEELGAKGFTVIVHGKRTHEETRATFSHSRQTAPTLVILDMHEAEFLVSFIKGQVTEEAFIERFKNSMSEGFSPRKHLEKIGVVNQTTMLATETQGIAAFIRQAMVEVYGEEDLKNHFADTRDTLCYATYENQSATRALIEAGADIAVVVGGYNSSNTSHLVELCEIHMPTYYICDNSEIVSESEIRHFDLHQKGVITTSNWLPKVTNRPIDIALTSGASCPDKTIDEVLEKIVSLFSDVKDFKTAFAPFLENSAQA